MFSLLILFVFHLTLIGREVFVSYLPIVSGVRCCHSRLYSGLYHIGNVTLEHDDHKHVRFSLFYHSNNSRVRVF